MIRENILAIQQRIREICARSNRDPSLITIVAVSKGRTVAQIKEARESGIIDIGESKVQEAHIKYNAIRTTEYASRIKWHMVGHLQTNKVKDAVKIFDLIQSIDSLHLAQEINAQAFTIGKVQDILIEVHTSGEITKFGVKPAATVDLVKKIISLRNIRVQGLMTIAPVLDNAEKARPYFKKMRELLENINSLHITHNTLHTLSMGMTDDFEVAIEEGATMVRLGRAEFER